MDESQAPYALDIKAAEHHSGGLSRAFLYEKMASGELPYIKIGRRRLIPRAALEDFLAAHTVAEAS